MAITVEQVLRSSNDLQQARTLADLVRLTETYVRATTRYRNTWIGWFDPDNPEMIRLLAASAVVAETMWETSPLIPRTGDKMFEELAAVKRPVVVVDARTDPRTNKAMVERFGSRTIINVPIMLGDNVKGSLGIGTFGDEGIIAPTAEELEATVLFATQLAPAFDRVQALAAQLHAEREGQRLQQHLQSLQRVELMGVLSAGVAHDLNNLMAVALTSLEVIDRDKLGDDAAALADATVAIERMREIAKQLLSLGKSSSGAKRQVELNERVASTIALVRPSIPRGVTVSHNRRADPSVEADPVQLEQAIANLIINARDAVGATGHIEATVDEQFFDGAHVPRATGARAGHFARVRVADSGPGIPKELQQSVFDPLFTTKPTGTGLGLAVVSRIVGQHQGFVSVESAPGQGAAFSVFLPMSE